MTQLLDMQIMFNDVLKRKVAIEQFEQWVYGHPDIEEHFGSPFYLQLISLDYRGTYIELDLKQLLEPVIPYPELENRRLKENLQIVASTNDDIATALDTIYDDYCDGYSFLRFLALAYALLSGAEGQLTISYRQRALLQEEARRIQSFFAAGKIKMTGLHEYADLRHESEQMELRNIESMLRKLEENNRDT
ncbi:MULTISPECIES: hypothetical protein [unclassified Brevibacillus]|uniref:hypothetical protein n=1 Tax=unclassified Brevibacillus TaxID=2684853 RepID=UPI00156AA451|nr:MULTISPECIES: hypothetical protein [unclassified Brevibacillus]NRQ55347.1 hypothetical protein [Brevibacillus sp. HD1.4A]UED66600.1 hypothetical protein HP435_14830 [Brevibacillus sp. HD3.3A]